MKTAQSFELIDHGILGATYFQGCGLHNYSDIAMGEGDNPADAIQAALDQLAASNWDADDLERRILAEKGWKEFPTEPSVAAEFPHAGGLYYYVSIRVSQR